MKPLLPVLWLTGNCGAGKTTLAFGMREYFNERADASHPLYRRVVVLDGDEMRATISLNEGLSAADRRTHNLRVARLAKLLADSGHLVIVAVIAPFTSVREEVSAVCDPCWVYVKRSGLDAPDRPYEPPAEPHLLVDNDDLDAASAHIFLRSFIENGFRSSPQHRVVFSHGVAS